MSGAHDGSFMLSEAAKAALVSELRRGMPPAPAWPSLLTSGPTDPYFAPLLTEDDVRRIVAEELDARKPGPLDVSPEDIRRYLGGSR